MKSFLLLAILCILSIPQLMANQTVTLMWDRNPEPNLTYTVKYKSDKEEGEKLVSTGDAIELTLALTPGTWTFSVCAINQEGVSGPYSDTVSTRIDTPPPGKVQNLKVIRVPVQGSNDKVKWKDIGFVYPDKNWRFARVKS